MSQDKNYRATGSSGVFYLSEVIHKGVLLVNKTQQMTIFYFFFFLKEETIHFFKQTHVVQDADTNSK